MNKKAFTLVELIVVITILAVLATVAFISFQGYGQSARDSTRLSDLKSMEKLLDLSKLTNNRYPTPVDAASVTYSGSVAWTQGVFGQTAYTSNASMSNVPVDPVTAFEYPYSITANGQEYQLAAVLENPVTSTITQATYAGTQEAQVYVKGNYNGQFLKVKKDGTTYLLGIPGIMTSDITSSQLLEDIITNNRLVYNGHKNLPASFSGSVYKTDGGFDFGGAPYVASDMILFEGDASDLETDPAQRAALFDKLQASYSGSVIQDVSGISELLSIDSSSASASSNYVAIALNNSLKTSIAVSNVSSGGTQGGESTPSCPSNPNPDSDFTFDIGANTITGYTGGGLTVVIPCTIAGVDVFIIGVESFQELGLTSVTLPSSITSIGDYAFYGNQLTSITIPEGVVSISEETFSDNQLTSIIIPNSVTTIGDYAFYGNQLTSLTLGENVTSIGEDAFDSNQLTSVTIPSSVTDIGGYAFYGNNLEANTITVDACSLPTFGDDVFSSNGPSGSTDLPNPVGEFTFDIDTNTITDYNSAGGIVVVPGNLCGINVTSIGDYAFEENSITSMTVSEGIITIGEGAFYGNQLTSFTFPSSVTTLGGYAFESNQITSIIIPDTVTSFGDDIFIDNQITSFTLPSNMTSIPKGLLRSNLLTNVTIPDGITTIGDYAFYDNQLTSVTIPSSVTSIGYRTFRNNLLTSVTIPDNVETIGGYAFQGNQLTSITIPSSVTSIGDGAFYGNKLEANTIVIMCGLPTFGSSVFSFNGPASVTNIADPESCNVEA